MKWDETSQIIAGLALAGKVSLTAIRPELLMPPFNEIIVQLKEGNHEPERLIETIGFEPVQIAIAAEKSINGLGEITNWLKLLEKTHMMYSTGQQLEKMGRKMIYGEEPDVGRIAHLMGQFHQGKTGRVPLSEIEEGETPFIPTGWKPIDDHLVGFPEAGLTIIGGNPGVGKSSLMAKIASKFVKKHPNKRVGVFSLEMILSEIAGRFREVENLTEEQAGRIEINESALVASEIISDAAGIENLGLVMIDFADYLVRGEVSEPTMGAIYRELAVGAKQLHIPIVLLSQLSRSYKGGIPRPYHIRWTSLAEALGWMILMLYNPMEDFYDEHDEETLPIQKGSAFICAWKVRGGFRLHPDNSPGAIMTGFRGKRGWYSDKSKWFSLKKEK